jgi:hypothetical protein
MKEFRKLILISCLMLIAEVANAQTAEFYQQKIDHYKTQQILGVALMATSLPMGSLGIYLIVRADRLLNDPDENADVWGNFFNGSFDLIAGIVCTAVGVGLLAGGTVMTAIAGNKIEKYQGMLDGLNVSIICTPEQKGLTLTYRF